MRARAEAADTWEHMCWQHAGGNTFKDNGHGAVFVGRDAALAEVELCNNLIHGTLWLGSKGSLFLYQSW